MPVLISLFLVFMFFTTPAHAYLDPGSGGVLFQIVAAIAVTLGIFWRKIKRLFVGGKHEQDEIDKAVQDIVKDNIKDR